LAGYIPLAALGAVLVVVAWNMAEKEEFWSLLRSSRGDAVVLLATFLLTIFVVLITGIAVGVVLIALLFLHRMAESVEIAGGQSPLEDVADDNDSPRYDAEQATNRDVMIYQISGDVVFAAARPTVRRTLNRAGLKPPLVRYSATARDAETMAPQ
jgi:SulP family sulfate permease